MSRPFSPSRRSLVQGLGLGAASLGLPRLSGRKAHAASTIPTRFVVFIGGGMIYDDPWPHAPGGGTPAETGWELGEVHAPLQPFKDRCLYVDGIGMVSNEVDTNKNQGNAHQQGLMHSLAAASTSKPALPGGPTIDQVIAQAINSPSPLTRFRSLQFLIGCWQGDLDNGGNSASASAANTTLPQDWDPRVGFKRVFGDFTTPGGGGGPSLADIQRQQQLSVMGLASDDFSQLASRLGKEAKARLDAHQSLLSDLQKRMQLLPPAPAACSKPTVAAITDNCMFNCWNSGYVKNYETSRDNNIRLASAALACDLTRVVSFGLQVPDQMTSFAPGTLGNQDLHGLTHMVCDKNMPASKDPAMRKPYKEANIVEAKTVAMLCDQLAQIPEADGKSVLDHTVVLFAGHIGYGSHDLGRLPWVVIGGGALGLKQGRYIKLPKDPKYYSGRPHNDYFLALAKACGVPLSTFGNPALCSGPISEMLV